jgi:hypothetical protein
LCKGRDHPALRSAALTGKELPFTVASRLEHCFDEAQHSAIGYSLSYQREKLLVIHGPEKVSEIRIYDPLRPALNLLPDFAQRVLRRSPAPIPKAGIIEYRLKDRLQPIEQRLLTHAIVDRGNAKHAILAWLVPLRDRVLAHRQRLIGLFFQLPMQPIQLLVQLRFEGLQSLPIYTPTAPVLLHLSPGTVRLLLYVHVRRSVDGLRGPVLIG